MTIARLEPPDEHPIGFDTETYPVLEDGRLYFQTLEKAAIWIEHHGGDLYEVHGCGCRSPIRNYRKDGLRPPSAPKCGHLNRGDPDPRAGMIEVRNS